jgi:CSLREA domain-containing protein
MRFSISALKLALIAVLAATLFFGAGSFAPAKASTFTVSTSADDNIPNGNCTLREAIRSAVYHIAVDACPTGTGNDLINFSVPSVTVNSPLPTITAGNNVTIYGGSTKVTLNITSSPATVFTSNANSTLTVQSVNFTGFGQVCFQSAGTLNIVNDDIGACSLSIVASAGVVNVQSTASHMIDTHSGSAVLNVSDSSLVGGVPFTLNFGTAGGTVSHTSFGAGQVHISTVGPITVDHSIMNNTGSMAGISAASTTVIVKNTIIVGVTQMAIDPEVGAQFTIINSTIVNNAYGINGTSGSVSLKNTILSNTNNCYTGAGGNYTLVNLGGNLQSASSSNCPLLPVGNPQLGRGFIPLAGSPVIDAGLNAGCLPDDVYDRPRPIDGDGNGTVICDIGAVEKP